MFQSAQERQRSCWTTSAAEWSPRGRSFWGAMLRRRAKSSNYERQRATCSNSLRSEHCASLYFSIYIREYCHMMQWSCFYFLLVQVSLSFLSALEISSEDWKHKARGPPLVSAQCNLSSRCSRNCWWNRDVRFLNWSCSRTTEWLKPSVTTGR